MTDQHDAIRAALLEGVARLDREITRAQHDAAPRGFLFRGTVNTLDSAEAAKEIVRMRKERGAAKHDAAPPPREVRIGGLLPELHAYGLAQRVEALEAEHARVTAERDALKATLVQIVEHHDSACELYTIHDNVAAGLATLAARAIGKTITYPLSVSVAERDAAVREAVLAEREACAQIAEAAIATWTAQDCGPAEGCAAILDVIRARPAP